MRFEVSPAPDERLFPYISVNFLPYVTRRTFSLSCPEMALRIAYDGIWILRRAYKAPMVRILLRSLSAADGRPVVHLVRDLQAYHVLYPAKHLIFREESGIQHQRVRRRNQWRCRSRTIPPVAFP